MHSLPLFLCILCGVFFLQSYADINPGSIGLQFFGNEYAYTQKIASFPKTDFSLTLRIQAKSGSILSYGVLENARFDSSHFSLLEAGSLVINRGQGQTWSTGVNFADSQWHALGLTWKMSTGQMILYKDGVVVGTNTIGKGSSMSINGFLVLGQQQNCAVGCFTSQKGLVGIIADVTIWDTVLSLNQIEYLSTNAPSGDELNLISFWPLFENKGLFGEDKSIGSNSLYIGGPTTSGDVGLKELASSVSLHKFDAVILPPQNDLPTGDFTIEFWIKTSTVDDNIILSYFMSSGGSSPFVIRNPGALTIIRNNDKIVTDVSLATGAWNHAAITWSQQTGRLRVYKNGALSYPPAWLPQADYDLMPTLNFGGVIPARPDRVVLGNSVICAVGSCIVHGSGLDALVQEFRFWNSVRTQKEVQETKDHIFSPDSIPSSLVLYWKLDDSPDSITVSDITGKGNDGTKTIPMWVNTIIAPPFPKLSDLNQQIINMRSQMSNIYDYIREALEPTMVIPRNETAFTVPNQGKCDRRYKYLCTLQTQSGNAAAASVAAAAAAAAATTTATTTGQGNSAGTTSQNPKHFMNLLVQKPNEIKEIDSSSLSHHLEPKAHKHRPNSLATSVQDNIKKEISGRLTRSTNSIQSNNLVQTSSSSSSEIKKNIFNGNNDNSNNDNKYEQKNHGTFKAIHKVYTTDGDEQNPSSSSSGYDDLSTHVVEFKSGSTSEGRKRHTWTTPQLVQSTNADIVKVNNLHFDLTKTKQKPRHAWATKIEVEPTNNFDNSNNNNNNIVNAGFLEEEENEIDVAITPASESLPQLLFDAEKPLKQDNDDADVEKQEREFEEEQKKFDNFKNEDDLDTWTPEQEAKSNKNIEQISQSNEEKKGVQVALEEDEGKIQEQVEELKPTEHEHKHHQHHGHHHEHNEHNHNEHNHNHQVQENEKNLVQFTELESHHRSRAQSRHHSVHHSHHHQKQQQQEEQQDEDENKQEKEENTQEKKQQKANVNLRQEVLKKQNLEKKNEIVQPINKKIEKEKIEKTEDIEKEVTKKADEGPIGGKFEQLIMAGSEHEWDEAIAEGIGNSDMSKDISTETPEMEK